MNNTTSTYDTTLVNDYTFYQAFIHDNYSECYDVATKLYDSYHSKDGLTISERYATIAAALTYLESD